MTENNQGHDFALIYKRPVATSAMICSAAFLIAALIVAALIVTEDFLLNAMAIITVLTLLLLAIVAATWRISIFVLRDKSSIVERHYVIWIPIYRRRMNMDYKTVVLQKDIKLTEHDEPYSYYEVRLTGPKQIYQIQNTINYDDAKRIAIDFANALEVELTEETAYPYNHPVR